MRPLCFVLMPFGQKPDPGGGAAIDFNVIYRDGIAPAIEAAGLEPVRADAEIVGGVIHKPMFERLVLCDFAVADLTTANANVFYELGVRHAVRPHTTVAIFAERQSLPFDVAPLRGLPYALAEQNRFGPAEAAALTESLAARLGELRGKAQDTTPSDSPLFQLLDGYRAPDISRLKTDVFREQVTYAAQLKGELARARDTRDPVALQAFRDGMGPADGLEAGVLVDLLLSYRALSDWDGMVSLYEELPGALKRSVLVREQLAFALNRRGDGAEALRVLEGIVEQQGPSSETCGLMGRVYKDRWKEALEAGKDMKARGFLGQAIDAYRRGFQADWRDAYPGINCVTLLDIRGDEASLKERDELVCVVRFAVQQRLRGAKPDYWDHATLLELMVLACDADGAAVELARALASVRELWEPETTANNLRLIRDAREARDEPNPWLSEIIDELDEAAAG